MNHLITAQEAAILGASAAGSFVALLVKQPGWKAMLSWFVVGQLTSFYWVAPLLMALMWDVGYSRGVGFGFGALGMLMWTAIFSLSQKFTEDPLGTFGNLWRTIRGQGGSEK